MNFSSTVCTCDEDGSRSDKPHPIRSPHLALICNPALTMITDATTPGSFYNQNRVYTSF
uniref:Uncharacterized protein n=1 Tax=Arundo donax TaxID=35708 RepID=A0A0A9B5L1_ARUDO